MKSADQGKKAAGRKPGDTMQGGLDEEMPIVGDLQGEDEASEEVEEAKEDEAEEEAEQEAEVLPDELQLAVAAGGALLVGLLYLILPPYLTPGPNWITLVLEVVLLAPPLVAVFFVGRRLPYRVARGLALALLGVLTAVLMSSVVLLVFNLLHFFGMQGASGANLLRDGIVLWAINIMVFAVWYWEIDGEGPLSRVQAPYLAADFQFPQQQNGNPTRWVPGFIDYIFLAFCFATALSPADTPPLTQRAKLLLMAQAAVSLTIIVLLVGRSVNILPS